MRVVRAALCLAQEVGQGLGERALLQRSLPHAEESPMRRDFASREEMEEYLRQEFERPADEKLSGTHGGKESGQALLAEVDCERYAKSRNHLDGAVTRLSPYLRHGVISLAEVRRSVLARSGPGQGFKLLQELAWRDYWQRVYAQIGERVWEDQEPSKTGHPAESYGEDLPEELTAGRTGLGCIDSFARELADTGYLHNHARMWVAAYVVHWLRVRWQVGARWFLRYLLDGDVASNNLSWQWVASTFSQRPYYFNRENLERYSGGRYCATCTLHNDCPFDDSYEALAGKLFKLGPEQPE
jgi:deoxyribodipyrimidine photo-lyase